MSPWPWRKGEAGVGVGVAVRTVATTAGEQAGSEEGARQGVHMGKEALCLFSPAVARTESRSSLRPFGTATIVRAQNKLIWLYRVNLAQMKGGRKLGGIKKHAS